MPAEVVIRTKASLGDLQKFDEAMLKNANSIKTLENESKRLDLAFKQTELQMLKIQQASQKTAESMRSFFAAEDKALAAMQNKMAHRVNLRHGMNYVMTPQMREALKSPYGKDPTTDIIKSQAEDAQFNRYLKSIEIRGERYKKAVQKAFSLDQKSAIAQGNLSSIVSSAMQTIRDGREADFQTWAKNEAPGILGQTAVNFSAAGGSFGESRLMTRARRIIASRIKETPELLNKVTEDEFEKMSQQMAMKMQKFSQAFQMAAGAAGAAIAGVIKIADNVGQAHELRSAGLLRENAALATVFGVGNNPSRTGFIRSQARNLSNGLGISIETVGDVEGRLASAFGDLDPRVAGTIKLAALRSMQLGVKDPAQFAIGMGAMQNMFGASLGGGTKSAQIIANRFFKAADIGAFDPDQITPYLAGTASAFQASGYDYTQLMSALAVASKSGMKPETYTTALRNIPLIMQKKGKRTTGDFAADMATIANMESPEMISLFGRDSFSMAKMVSTQGGMIRDYNKQIGSVDSNQDIIQKRIAMQYRDPKIYAGNVIKSAREIASNAPAGRLDDATVNYEIGKAGFAMAAPAWANDSKIINELYSLSYGIGGPTTMKYAGKAWKNALFGNPFGAAYYSVKALTGDSEMPKENRLALFEMISAKREAKDIAMASALELQFGKETNKSYIRRKSLGGQFDPSQKLKQLETVYTGKSEAEEYLKLVSGGYSTLTSSGYLNWKSTGKGLDRFKDKESTPSKPIPPDWNLMANQDFGQVLSNWQSANQLSDGDYRVSLMGSLMDPRKKSAMAAYIGRISAGDSVGAQAVLGNAFNGLQPVYDSKLYKTNMGIIDSSILDLENSAKTAPPEQAAIFKKQAKSIRQMRRAAKADDGIVDSGEAQGIVDQIRGNGFEQKVLNAIESIAKQLGQGIQTRPVKGYDSNGYAVKSPTGDNAK